MKLNYLIIIFLFIACAAFGQIAGDESILGSYKTEDGAIIKIEKTDQGILAKDPDKKIILKDLQKVGSKWKGTIQDPKNDMSANCEITIAEGRLKIIARKAFITKTLTWVLQK
jgi:uncharacterized protein (DUF2147 family)